MSMLIVGGDSLIGRSLREACFQRNLPYHATSRRVDTMTDMIPMDIAEDPARWKLPDGIEVAVICAAVTAISFCEADPIRTRYVNVEAPALLASMLQVKGTAVVFLSTNLVFGGHRKAARWNDPLQPETTYGRQKAEAESLITKTGAHTAILRITKVVHPSLQLFSKWATRLKSGLVIEPFSDVVFSPISLAFVTEVILEMVKGFEPGIFQISGDRDISYASAATLLAKHLQVSDSLVQPRSSQSAGLNISFAPLHTTMTPHLPHLNTIPCPAVEETLISIFDHFKL